MPNDGASLHASQRGLRAGRLDYPISANPCSGRSMASSWQRGWFEGMREAGHQIPTALKPLEARLTRWTKGKTPPPERP